MIRIRVGEGQTIAFGRDDDGRDRVDKWKRSEEGAVRKRSWCNVLLMLHFEYEGATLSFGV